MTNTPLIIIYALLGVVSLSLILFLVLKKQRTRLDRYVHFLLLMLFLWQVCKVLFYSCSDVTLSAFLYDIDLPFVALSCLAYFLLIIKFYGLDSFFPPVVVLCLFVFPLMTLGIAAFGPENHLLRTTLEIVATTPMHIVSATRGPWFWVHSIYCYLLIVTGFVLAAFQHVKVPKVHRFPSTLLLAGIVIAVSGNLLVLARSFEPDLSVISVSISSVLFYFASQNNQGLSFFQKARLEVFQQLGKAVFILDDEGAIVNMNRAAVQIVTDLDGDLNERYYERIAERFRATTLKTEILAEEDAGIDYLMESGRIINARRIPILDKQRSVLGTFVVLTDETASRTIIRQLDDISGVDALTGLLNRRQLDIEFQELDLPELLPLAIIV
ncbi:hypothetical protein LJC34_05635, partial [Oscillospiraceae bacterium OttesenSCG-928-G22]|nr:hypothetical protein [Oscillospiraceae bacterium OttesenSCG-928-G22]